MTVTVQRYVENSRHSLTYFLRHETYTKSSETKTMKNFFSGLSIEMGHPGSTDEISIPSIYTVLGAIPDYDEGWVIDEREFPFSLYGYCGGHDDEGQNKIQRDQILNDCIELLRRSEYIDYYEYPDFDTVVANMQITDVVGRPIAPLSTQEIDRYRFIVDFSLYILE